MCPLLLCRLLRPKHFECLMSHVQYYRIIYHSSLSKNDILLAKEIHAEFSKQYKSLYGEDNANTIKYHSMMHVFDEALLYGPPCTYHTKPFEHYHVQQKRLAGQSTRTGEIYATKITEVLDTLRWNYCETVKQKEERWSAIDQNNKYLIEGSVSTSISNDCARSYLECAKENKWCSPDDKINLVRQVSTIKRDRTQFSVKDHVVTGEYGMYAEITALEVWKLNSKSMPVAFLKYYKSYPVSDRHLCPNVKTCVTQEEDVAMHINNLTPSLLATRSNIDQFICT
ncbi:hypothetical protein AKO1_002726, partial [Acrasis kona]